MIYIDFEGKTPVNTPQNIEVPDWEPWTQEKWEEWLRKSCEYNAELIRLHGDGSETDIKKRNAFIDSKSSHWGELKPWLQAISHGKCWFSEVRELYSHYDVEHFRPKKEKIDVDGNAEDGYWWLAFEYTNYRLCGNVGNRKKGGWFPLKQGSLKSSFVSRCEESETHFFLDPTDPHDPELIAFNEEGNPVPSPNCETDWQKQRVEETIKRLKLREHEPLVEARRKIWQEISREIEQYLSAKSKLSAGCNPGIKAKVNAHVLNIKKASAKASELSSVAVWCLYFRNDPSLLKLIS